MDFGEGARGTAMVGSVRAVPVRDEETGHVTAIRLWCAGCERSHYVRLMPTAETPVVWTFNGDFVWPSLAEDVCAEIQTQTVAGYVIPRQFCRFHLTDGTMTYAADCTHHLAGKTARIPIVELAS